MTAAAMMLTLLALPFAFIVAVGARAAVELVIDVRAFFKGRR